MRPAAALPMLALALAACIPSVDERPYGRAPAPTYDVPQERYDAPSLPPADRGRDEDDVPPSRVVVDVPQPAAARPPWEARPVLPDAQIVEPGSYTVQPGETLGRVADRTGASAEAIARANDLSPPFALRAGQRLSIPGGRYHLVRQGESGIAIARAYGVEWSRIVAANDLSEPYILRVGQRVLIPMNADGKPTPSRADRAAAFTLDIDDIITGGEPTPAPRQQPARPAQSANRVLPPSAVVVAPTRLTGGAFQWPVEGRIVKRFGPGASGVRNDGIEIAVPTSTPIRATADGVVAYAGDGIAALGGLVIVKHGSGWTSVYGHAAKLLVQRGQAIRRGQPVALSGDSGFADQPEVHFELRKGRTPIDPLTQLPSGRG